MTGKPLQTVALLLSLFAPVGMRAADPAPTPARIERWVRELGADDFATRENASEQLWKAGRAAEAALTRAIDSDDLEVARRARALLDKFRWGIYPDTPADVAALITRYRKGDASARQQAVRELFTKGRPGFDAVRKFAELEKDANQRRRLTEQIAREGWRLVRALVAEQDFKGAEKLLDDSLSSGEETLYRHYAAFHLLRGTAEKRAKELRELLEKEARRVKSVDAGPAGALLYLCRARGDLDGALWAARAADRPDWIRALLDEKGDWKAVADFLAESAKGAPEVPPRRVVLRATFLRLAGDRKAYEAELRRVLELDPRNTTEFFHFNGMPERAVAALQRKGYFGQAFEVLEEQGKFAEALALKPPEGTDPRQRFSLDVQRARLLVKLGEEEKGRKRFAALADEVARGKPDGRAVQLLNAERKVGGVEEALAHLGRFLDQDKPPADTPSLFRAVFPDHAEPARLWWEVLGEAYPKEKTMTRLGRLQEVFDQKKAGADFEELARRAVKGENQAQRLAWVAETCELVGHEGAREYWEHAARVDPAMQVRLGDFHLRNRRWAEAAGAYRRAWERDRQDIAALYLSGHCLVKAGKEKEGRSAIERARWQPLADEAARYTLAEALKKRGLLAEAAKESDFLVRTSTFRSVYTANVLTTLAGQAAKDKEYLRVADDYERISLILLQGGGAFLDTRAYVLVPARAAAYRVRGHLAAGKIDKALEAYEMLRKYYPADVGVSIELVRGLKDRPKDADRVYGEVRAVLKKRCDDFPRSARCLNQAAWFSVRCGRDLDDALTRASRATALEPRNTGYLDTLAEVHFRRGDRDKAVEVMRECLRLEPGNARHRARLREFQGKGEG